MATTIAEINWLTSVFNELRVDVNKLVIFLRDSKATIQIGTHPIFHERTNYMDIDFHFIREKIQYMLVQTQHIGTREHMANPLTKSLCKH